MPRRVGCDVSAFDGREKKKKREQNEGILTLLSLFLSLGFLFSLPSCILSDDFICQFFFLFFFLFLFSPAVRSDENENGDAIFFASSCSHLKAKIFLLLFFFFLFM
jgi:hypothetical protein